jgi:hypothetical protein
VGVCGWIEIERATQQALREAEVSSEIFALSRAPVFSISHSLTLHLLHPLFALFTSSFILLFSLSLFHLQSLRVLGKDVTPFILKRIHELTAGRSVSSNIALVGCFSLLSTFFISRTSCSFLALSG